MGGFRLSIEVFVSGFLFLFLIVIAFVATLKFGSEAWTVSDLDSDAKLQEINDDPEKFRISIVLALIEHVGIISLAVMLFLAFGPFSVILAVVWTLSRTGEGLIHIYSKGNYWGLLSIARQYSGTSGAERDSLIDLGRSILKTKNSSFIFTQILFSIGTLAYSILFVTSGVVPQIIGWLGIVASIVYGLGNGIRLVRPNLKVLGNFGGLLVLLFEIVLGGWLVGLGLTS